MTEYVVFASVWWRLAISPQARPSTTTDGAELPPPSQLEIVTYPDDPGFYLLYLDDEGNELTDTYHDSQAEAMRQARWEFRVEEDEWEVVENE